MREKEILRREHQNTVFPRKCWMRHHQGDKTVKMTKKSHTSEQSSKKKAREVEAPGDRAECCMVL